MSDFDDPELEGVQSLGKALGLLDAKGDLNVVWLSDPMAHTTKALRSPAAAAHLFEAFAALGGSIDADGVRRFPIMAGGPDLLLRRSGPKLSVGVGYAHDENADDLHFKLGVSAFVLDYEPKPALQKFSIGTDANNDFVVAPSLSFDADISLSNSKVTRCRIAVTGENAGTNMSFTVSVILDFVNGEPVELRWQIATGTAAIERELLVLGVTGAAGLLRVLTTGAPQAAQVPVNLAHALLRLTGFADLAQGGRLPTLDVGALRDDAAGTLRGWLNQAFDTNHGANTLDQVLALLTAGQGAIAATPPTLPFPTTRAFGALWTPPESAAIRFGVWAAVADVDGVPTLLFGVRAEGGATGLNIPAGGSQVDADFDLLAEVSTTIARIPLSGASPPRADGATSLVVRLQDGGDRSIVHVTHDGKDYEIGGFEAGISFTPGRPATPVLALLNVKAPPLAITPRYDLLDLDNAARLGAAAGTAGLLAALAVAGVDLQTIAGIGQKVGAILGLLAPPGAPAGFPTVAGPDLLVDPAAAYRVWLQALLTPGTGGTRPIVTWLDTVRGALADLTGAPVPAITGDGNPASPYRLCLHARPPAIHLDVVVSGPTDGRLGVEVALTVDLPALALDRNVELAPHARFVLLDATLPAPVGGVGAPTLGWLPRIATDATLRPVGVPALTLTVPAPLSATVSTTAVELVLPYERNTAFTPTFILRGLGITRGSDALLSPTDLSLADLLSGATPPDLPRLLSIALAVGVAALSPEAADRALAVPRFLGLVPDPGAFPAIDTTALMALLQNPGAEIPRLFRDRLLAAAWSSGGLRNDAVALPFHLLFGGALDAARRPEVDGAGTWERPWRVALRDGDVDLRVDLLVWLGPDGPTGLPAGWVDALFPESLAADGDAALAAGLRAAAAFDADLSDRLAGLDPSGATGLDGAVAAVARWLAVAENRAAVVTALRARLTAYAAAAAGRAAPTHLGVGLRLRHHATAHRVQGDTSLELRIAQIPLTAGAPAASHTTPTATLRSDLYRPGGDLLGAPTSDVGCRSLHATATWEAATGFDIQLSAIDVHVRAIRADRVELDDALVGELFEALARADRGPFQDGGAGRALVLLLQALGVTEVPGVGNVSLLAGPVSEIVGVASGAMGADAWLRSRLLDGARPRVELLAPAFMALGATATNPAAGPWRFALGTLAGHAVALAITPEGVLSITGGQPPGPSGTFADGSVSLALVTRTLRVGAGLHPSFQGLTAANLRFDLATGPEFSTPATTLRLIPLDEPGPTLLGAGLDLVPPASDLGPRSLRILGLIAAGLVGRLVVEGHLLPLLPEDVANLLVTLGLVRLEGGDTRRIGDAAGLAANPAGFFTAAARLEALETTRSVGDVEISLQHDPTATARALSVRLRTPGAGITVGDLSFAFSGGLLVDLPSGDGAPTGVRPVADATLTVALNGPKLGLRFTVDGADLTFALVVTPSGSGSPFTLSLLPWKGIGDAVLKAAANQLLPLAVEELLVRLRAGTGDVAATGEAVASLLIALGVGENATSGRMKVSGPQLLAFLQDPETAWAPLVEPNHPHRAERLSGFLGFVAGILDRTPLTVSAPAPSASLLRVTLHPSLPIALVVGARPSDQALGVSLEVTDDFPSAAASLSGTKIGAWLDPAEAGEPEAVIDVRFTASVDLGEILETKVPWLLGARASLTATTDGALTASIVARAEGQDVLTARVLPTFQLTAVELALGDTPVQAIVLELAVPLGLAVLTQLHEPLLRKRLGGSVEVGDILTGAGLLRSRVSLPKHWRPAMRSERPKELLPVLLGALSSALNGTTAAGVTENGRIYVNLPTGDPIALTGGDGVSLSVLRGKGVGLPKMLESTQPARLYLAKIDRGNVTLSPGIELDMLGLRASGSGGALIDTPIGLGMIDVGLQLLLDGGEPKVGAAVHVGGLRFPFGGEGTSGSNNPVAASMFSERATSPTIGCSVGFRYNDLMTSPSGSVEFQLEGNPDADGTIWMNLGARLGPLEVQRFGVRHAARNPGIKDDRLSLLFDARLSLGGLEVEAWGLGFSFQLATPLEFSQWTFELDGMGAIYQQGSVLIAGDFLKVTPPSGGSPSYVGAALVRVPSFELQAVGAYSVIDKDPSLFVFARATVPLGGPPFFFVTGFAGGFGYNRTLVLPKTMEDVENGPFVRLLAGSSDLISQLPAIAADFPAKRGAYWIAGGVTFTSFVLVQGQAVVYALLGEGFTLGLVGRAQLALPTAQNPLLNLELVLDAGFSTTNDDPRLWVRALLTSRSFLLHRNVQTTGGFALYIWFKRANFVLDDFVLSIGGYCSAFAKPSRYPDVPRVGVRWQIGSSILLKGGAYFAITPREAMGGAEVLVTGEWGPVKARFAAGIDVMIGWDPFYYYVRFYIEISGSIDLWLCEPSFSVGADVTVRGPELGGCAHVKICGIGVTIEFGAQSNPNRAPLDISAWTQKSFSASNPLAIPGLFSFEAIKGRLPSKTQAERDTDDGRRAVGLEASFALRTKLPATLAAFEFGSAGAGTLPIGRRDGDDAPEEKLDLVMSARADLDATLTLTFDRLDDAKTGVHPSLTREQFVAGHVAYRTSRQPVAQYKGEADGDAFLPVSDGDSTIALIDAVEVNLPPVVVTADALIRDAVVDQGGTFRLPLTRLMIGNVSVLDTIFTEMFGLSVVAADVLPASARTAERLRDPLLASRPALAAGWSVAPSVTPAPSAAAPVTNPPPTRVFRAANATVSTRAVLRGGAGLAATAAPRTRTTVSRIAGASALERVSPPTSPPRSPVVAGIELLTAPAASARAAAPKLAAMARRDRPSDHRKLAVFDKELSAAVARLGAGDVVVIDVPRGAPNRLRIDGDQPVRAVLLGPSGDVFGDLDLSTGRQDVRVAPEVTQVVLVGLGATQANLKRESSGPLAALPARTRAPVRAPTFGGVSLATARGNLPAVGFDADHPLLLVAPGTWLARGARLVARAGTPVQRPFGVLPAAKLLRDVPALTVTLPSAGGTLIVTTVATATRRASASASVRLTVGRSTKPVIAREVSRGDQTALLVPMNASGAIDVAVATRGGWRITGVFLVPGATEDWLTRLPTLTHWNLVEDGPVSDRGTTTLGLDTP